MLALAISAIAPALSPISVRAESLLLTGASVHTVSGETFSPGQVLIQNGKITAVGATVPSGGAQTAVVRARLPMLWRPSVSRDSGAV